ncbi:MAG: hypothetical protein ABIL58_11545 [Pseudomonadota bacterium]
MSNIKLSSPGKEAVKAFTSTIVGVVPIVGPAISSTLTAAIQADNTKKFNEIIKSIEKDIQDLKVPIESLLNDSIFRGGISQLCLSIFKNEPREKLNRIRNFIRHRLKSPGKSNVIEEAVLKVFESLPSGHIEEFLSHIAHNDLDLYDFSVVMGDEELNLHELVNKVVPAGEIQESCGAPANIRWKELVVLYSSLSNVGLVKPMGMSDDPITKSAVYKTTELAKPFVYYCLDPKVDYEAEIYKKAT